MRSQCQQNGKIKCKDLHAAASGQCMQMFSQSVNSHLGPDVSKMARQMQEIKCKDLHAAASGLLHANVCTINEPDCGPDEV